MRYKLSKNYIRKMRALSKHRMLLYTTEKASWRNCWLLFRSGKKIVKDSKEVIGYREYAEDKRSNYWYTQDGEWYDSSTRKPARYFLQDLFNHFPLNIETLEIKID